MSAKKIQTNNYSASSDSICRYNIIQRIWQFISNFSFGCMKNKSNIAVLRLEGAIGKIGLGKTGLTLDGVSDLIDQAFKTNNLSAVCLVINSPGGSPVQSDLISKRISNLAAQKNVPVYSFVEDLAASGGYWIACAGEKIYANKSSIVGSIGVTSRGFGFCDAIEKLGIERRVYTQGKNKSVLDPFKPALEKDIKLLNNLQKDIHQHFIETVKISRHKRLTQSDDILFDGTFWSGQTALDYGLIDGLESLHSFIHNKFGEDAKIKYIKPRKSWLQQKLSVEDNIHKMGSKILSDFYDQMIQKAENDKFDIS